MDINNIMTIELKRKILMAVAEDNLPRAFDLLDREGVEPDVVASLRALNRLADGDIPREQHLVEKDHVVQHILECV